jgi:hypothetical protein
MIIPLPNAVQSWYCGTRAAAQFFLFVTALRFQLAGDTSVVVVVVVFAFLKVGDIFRHGHGGGAGVAAALGVDARVCAVSFRGAAPWSEEVQKNDFQQNRKCEKSDLDA